MKRYQLEMLLNFVKVLYEATDEIEKQFAQKRYPTVVNLLGDCQEAVGNMVEYIEETEVENTRSVELLVEYYKRLYQFASEIETVYEDFVSDLRKEMKAIEDCILDELRPKKIEIAFLPYKASMWDSLESVWMAAKDDPQCEVYVVPIPYYDRRPDGSLGKFHYEGNQFPDYVPITHYEIYDIKKRRPDIIYIHNPYDAYNRVTSVDPLFYSHELKKYTDILVYIPYYSTSGGMAEGQRNCPAYEHADYIVTQAEKYRHFFDAKFENKLLPLGSPKLDRVIRICNQPPEPPADWKEKMTGKKVYFYNTSISGLLSNTEMFLKKMEYVFRVFAEQDDACLLWRPHPLLESTLDSMRPQFKQKYAELKKYFIENNIGIYDDTPDATNTIALSDAYIGDSGTSIISLFGITGKPIFILKNHIHTEPSEEDWRGEIITGVYNRDADEKYLIARGGQLYYSPDNNYKYQYLCDLSDYAHGYDYLDAITVGDKTYICPHNAQDILVLYKNKIIKRISLEKRVGHPGTFAGAVRCGKYIFLVPRRYPMIVKLNTENDEIQYFNAHPDVITGNHNGELVVGGYCVHKGYLFIASPTSNLVLAIEAESGKAQMLTTGAKNANSCMLLSSDGTNLWLMPFSGSVVTCWNPETGEVREYSNFPEHLKCRHIHLGYECMERPFSLPAFYGEDVYLAPFWANMFVKLNRVTGEAVEWRPPIDLPDHIRNDYYFSWCKGWFLEQADETKHNYKFFSQFDRKLYKVNLKNNQWEEIHIEFDSNELKEYAPGFQKHSEWLKYGCEESAFNSLVDFLKGDIQGAPFKKEEQIEAYKEIAANHDGTCGEKVHRFMKDRFESLLGRLSV